MVTVWWSAANLIHYSFLNFSKTITPEKYAQQIDEMHQKMQHCGQHWSTERAQFSTTMTDHTSHNQHFKSWTNMKFCLICHILLTSRQSTTTSSSISTTFCRGKCFHKQQEAEKAFQGFVNSQSTDFYTTGISKRISCWHKCFDWNGSCFY